MTEQNYAFIKENDVINVVVFDNPSEDLLNHFKNEFNLDNIIIANENSETGGTYEDNVFWRKKPYASWIKDEELKDWKSPISYPEDGKSYIWDEDSISWIQSNTI